MAAFCSTDETEFMGWLTKHGYLPPIDANDLLVENEQLYREANKQ